MDSYLQEIKEKLPSDILYHIARLYRIKYREEHPVLVPEALTVLHEILHSRDDDAISRKSAYQCYTIGPSEYIVFCKQNNYMRCIYLREKPRPYEYNHLQLVYKSPFYISADTEDIVILSPLHPNTAVHFTYRRAVYACLVILARNGFPITGDTLIHINNKNTHPIRDVFAKIVPVRSLIHGTNDVWDVSPSTKKSDSKCTIS